MSITGDDCYFYYYSTCTKGEECPFRHCELALGTETVCTLWREGLCSRANCKFRHMESRIDRSNIACYWENQPGGCRKPHCVFLHKKGRTSSPSVEKNQGLILPVSSQNSPLPQVPSTADAAPDSAKTFAPKDTTTENLPLTSPSVPVEPVVVRLIDEESDTESTTSTPAKNLANRASLERSIQKLLDFEEDRDWGVKTLEQLRMEKIHRESEHFYKSIYDEPLLEIHDMGEEMDPVPDKKQRYATFAEGHHLGIHTKNLDRNLDSLPHKRKLSDTTSNVTCDSTSDDKLASNDLRDVIKSKKKRVDHTKSLQPKPKKRFISLKTSDTLNDDTSLTITVGGEKIVESQVIREKSVKEPQEVEKLNKGAFDFKVKTLAEIRREKGKKTMSSRIVEDDEKSPETEEEMEQVPVTTLKSTVQTVAKPKIKRPAREIYQVKPNSLSPRKDSTLKETERKMLKLSPPRKKTLSCIQKVTEISKSPESFNDKSKKDNYEILNPRTLKLNKKMRLENGHEEHNGSVNSRANNAENKSSSLKSIQSFIRPSVIPQLFPVEHLNDKLSLTNANSCCPDEPAVDNVPMDCAAVDSTDADSAKQLQTNGIPSAVDEIVSNYSHQDHDFNSKFRKVSASNQDETASKSSSSTDETASKSSSSTDETASKSSSSTDDLEKLLFADECDLNLDDLRGTSEKGDDIFLEIDKLLKS